MYKKKDATTWNVILYIHGGAVNLAVTKPSMSNLGREIVVVRRRAGMGRGGL